MHAHTVIATRISGALAEAHSRAVCIPVATMALGRDDALSPVELLLAAIAGGVLAGVEQAARALTFQFDSATVDVSGDCKGRATPGLSVEYDLTVDTAEGDGRLMLFHEHVRHGDVLMHLGAAGAQLTGRVRRLRRAARTSSGPRAKVASTLSMRLVASMKRRSTES